METPCSNHKNPCLYKHYIFLSTLVSQLMWAPHSFLEAYLHVMHIYDAFLTTHRIPTAAESPQQPGSLVSKALILFVLLLPPFL